MRAYTWLIKGDTRRYGGLYNNQPAILVIKCGLRDYKLPPLIWDAKERCHHNFNEYDARLLHENRQNLDGGTIGNDEFREKLHGFGNAKAGFCSLCGCWKGSLGLEPDYNLYLTHLMQIMAECKRVLKKSGTMWVNIGDSYGGNCSRASNGGRAGYGTEREGVYSKPNPKSLIGIPERFAIRMTDELHMIRRNTIIWHKCNCMPSSARDRFTVDFEYVYMFVKQGKYYFEQQFKPYTESLKGRPVRPHEQGRNMRAVWDIPTEPSSEPHFAMFPKKLVEPMLKAGCPPNGIVLDPFAGMCIVASVAIKQGKQFIMFELNPEYVAIAQKQINQELQQLELGL